jgi:hypothetical protein
MGENGLARLTDEGYTWPAVAAQFVELYEHVKQSPATIQRPDDANKLIYQIENVSQKTEKWEWERFLRRLFDKGSAG